MHILCSLCDARAPGTRAGETRRGWRARRAWLPALKLPTPPPPASGPVPNAPPSAQGPPDTRVPRPRAPPASRPSEADAVLLPQGPGSQVLLCL